ncbi:MAG TPA: carbohydrate-binding protein, partial [Cytophagales bacterium]
TVYWGEIGPDAGQDSLRGPRGYDEFNQAKKPGFYGWPYFVGNNYAYAEWDFATRTAGPNFDPKAPVNNSPNNTGLRELPPATPAMIWYPYAASPEFPELGQGGRSAMAGEFYTYNPNASSPNKFPQYYDGALFVFDWMRNWVLALRFDQNENYLRNEPFMTANGDFRRPIDLAFGKDGVMYMLEYGSVYGADNEDARLVKIEYNTGNRAPIAHAVLLDSAADARLNKRMFLTSDRRGRPELREMAGPAPLRVSFASQGTRDLDDDDQITYQWLFDGKTVGATTAAAKHTYTEPGVYAAVLKVTDQSGAMGLDTVTVRVGNARPEVTVTTPGNRSFYWPGKPFPYAVRVSDAEDKKIDPRKVKVSFVYNAQPGGQTAARPGNAPAAAETASLGKTLVANSDCKACHTVDKVAVGPSFVAVSQRYKKQDGSVDKLAGKIINGGGGNWGTEHVMSAHPQLSKADAAEMVKYIFSLTDAQQGPQTLPAKGSLALTQHTDTEPAGQYTLVATYTDNGAKGAGPLTATDVVTLRNAKVRTVYNDGMGGFQRWGNNLGQGDHKSFIVLKNVDLTGIRRFTYEYASKDKDGEIEVRLHSQGGPVVSRTPYKATGDWKTKGQVTGELAEPLTGHHDVYFVVVKRDKPNDDIIQLSTIGFEE